MGKQTVTATVFTPPNGKRKVIEVTKVYPDDAAYIEQNDVKVSLEEQMTGDTVVYFVMASISTMIRRKTLSKSSLYRVAAKRPARNALRKVSNY